MSSDLLCGGQSGVCAPRDAVYPPPHVFEVQRRQVFVEIQSGVELHQQRHALVSEAEEMEVQMSSILWIDRTAYGGRFTSSELARSLIDIEKKKKKKKKKEEAA